MASDLATEDLPWEIIAQPLSEALKQLTVRCRKVVFLDVFSERFSPFALLTEHVGKVVNVLWAQILSGEYSELPCYVAHLSLYWGGKVL